MIPAAAEEVLVRKSYREKSTNANKTGCCI